MQERNSNPEIEFSKAKFETVLSNAEAPAIIVFLLKRDMWENDLSNLGDTTTLADPAVVESLIENRQTLWIKY